MQRGSLRGRLLTCRKKREVHPAGSISTHVTDSIAMQNRTGSYTVAKPTSRAEFKRDADRTPSCPSPPCLQSSLGSIRSPVDGHRGNSPIAPNRNLAVRPSSYIKVCDPLAGHPEYFGNATADLPGRAHTVVSPGRKRVEIQARQATNIAISARPPRRARLRASPRSEAELRARKKSRDDYARAATQKIVKRVLVPERGEKHDD